MASSSGGHLRSAKSTEQVDSFDAETSLIRAVYVDSKAELLSQTKLLAGAATEPLNLDRATASKLLHLCCNFDSAECASALLAGEVGTIPLVNELNQSGKSPLHTAAAAHSARCVEVLLKNHARTDLRTKDGQAHLPLELSLCDAWMDVNWNPNDFSIEDLVTLVREKDLSAVKLLSDKTKETAEVAYAYAVQGRVAALTALLIVAAEQVNDSVLEWRDSESGSKEKVTIYECLTREALALGRITTPLRAAKRTSTIESEILDKRKVLLLEIELLQLFGAVGQIGGADNKVNGVDLAEIQGGETVFTEKALRISSGGEARILCRRSSLSDEKGCILSVNDGDSNLEMGASLSVPLDVLDARKEFESGTTIVAVKFKEGLVFGVDARIVRELNGEKLIVSDDSVKFLVISEISKLVYLLSGNCKQCQDLYVELVNMVRLREATKLVTTREAIVMIRQYLDKFVKDHPDNSRAFAGILGGWSETEGFEAYEFGLNKTSQIENWSIDEESHLSLGSGSQHATYVLQVRTMTSGADMSKLEAVETVMKALLYASYLCDSTGGKLSAYSFKENGIVTTEKVLESCNVDPEYHKYRASRILIVLLDKLFAGWNVNDMTAEFKTLWPAAASSRVAVKKACYYYRLFFNTFPAAEAAFKEVTKKSVSPQESFVHHTMKSMKFVKKDGKEGFVNVGKCTTDLLQHICDLE